MRVAALQFDILRGDVAANRSRVEEGIRSAAEQGVELLALPEMWATSFVVNGDEARWLEETEAAWAAVVTLAREHGIALCGSGFGSAPAVGERLRNRFALYEDGRELLTYDKVHLFSPTGEAVGFSAGQAAPTTVELRGMQVSAMICYDLRFAPLMWAAHEAGAELIVVPAQWPIRRQAHWRALLIGRAVEHQAFVLGVNRIGRETIGRRGIELEFPGNSMIVSPHGAVLAEAGREEGLVMAELDSEELRELRRRVPVRRDQRPDVYRG